MLIKGKRLGTHACDKNSRASLSSGYVVRDEVFQNLKKRSPTIKSEWGRDSGYFSVVFRVANIISHSEIQAEATNQEHNGKGQRRRDCSSL